MVMCHHVWDGAFDAFNAGKFHQQLMRYYAGGILLVMVAPRTTEGAEYFLVRLQNKLATHNMLCKLGFPCMRQCFGVTMLVKRRCFVCHKPTPKHCKGCHCACF